MLTTIQDAEMTTHTLSQNIQLHVLKDEFFADDNFAQNQLFASGQSEAQKPLNSISSAVNRGTPRVTGAQGFGSSSV